MTTVNLTPAARRLWGKSDRADNSFWLPLYVHLSDAGHVAGHLWDGWLPSGTKSVMVKEFGDPDDEVAQTRARQFFIFLAAIHDLGKATPVFQFQPTTHMPGHEGESLSQEPFLNLADPVDQGGAGFFCPTAGLRPNHPTHAVAGQALLTQFLSSSALNDGRGFPLISTDTNVMRKLGNCRLISCIRDSICCILGGHHGIQPYEDDVDQVLRFGGEEAYLSPMAVADHDPNEHVHPIAVEYHDRPLEAGEYFRPWRQARASLIQWAMEFSEFDFSVPWTHPLSPQSQTLLTGLVIMADWIASNQDLFPLVPLQDSGIRVFQPVNGDDDASLNLSTVEGLDDRARIGWESFDLEGPWIDPDRPTDVDQLFRERFSLPEGARPRAVQRAAFEAVTQSEDPRLLVIEAPMGEGKTEAALAAAEILAERTGRGGVCVALPTMATTDAMFSRVEAWLEKLRSGGNNTGLSSKTVYLAHSNAQLNRQFSRIASFSFHARQESNQSKGKDAVNDGDFDNPEVAAVAEDEEAENWSSGQGRKPRDLSQSVIASDWMWGRKKGVLSNFLVCTVDQVLMAALRMKHAVLRDLALANKVIVIDECHAYDSYMREYLKRALQWLGACGAPVVLLSATLPENMRDEYVGAYGHGYATYRRIGTDFGPDAHPLHSSSRTSGGGRKSRATPVSRDVLAGYPLLTILDGLSVRYVATQPTASRRVTVRTALIGDGDDELIARVKNLIKDGGCIGVICDTVRRAQHAYDVLLDSRVVNHDELMLLHSRFTSVDRMQKEGKLRSLLGPSSTIDGSDSTKPLRPHRLVVVGTQVLEQSLDIDFDALITDIAPVDLIFQRLGRVHRHHRGDGECQRPAPLRVPTCFIRGLQGWDKDTPLFEVTAGSRLSSGTCNPTGISWATPEAKGVYSRASLLETLAVLGLTSPDSVVKLRLPDDIASKVRRAYDSKRVESVIPSAWMLKYQQDTSARNQHDSVEKNKARGFLYDNVQRLWASGSSLMGNNIRQKDGNNEDEMICAVRDTKPTLSVLILRVGVEDGEKVVRLLPWLGGESGLGIPAVKGGSDGMAIPLNREMLVDPNAPDEIPADLARLAAQCSVTLPQVGVSLDTLISTLEKADGQIVVGWQRNRYLAGQLPLFVNDDGQARLEVKRPNGNEVELDFVYTRERGLERVKVS
jgi:CRISPR-associated endonuclease/helicase Cas3